MHKQRIFEVMYIKTTVAALWNALTNPDITQQYWFDTRIESAWQVGSTVLYLRNGEVTDEHIVLAIDEPRLISHTFKPAFGDFAAEAPSRVTFLLAENNSVVRLTVIHEGFPPQSKVFRACSDGWPMILSNLKSLLETGTPLSSFEFEPQASRFEYASIDTDA